MQNSHYNHYAVHIRVPTRQNSTTAVNTGRHTMHSLSKTVIIIITQYTLECRPDKIAPQQSTHVDIQCTLSKTVITIIHILTIQSFHWRILCPLLMQSSSHSCASTAGDQFWDTLDRERIRLETVVLRADGLMPRMCSRKRYTFLSWNGYSTWKTWKHINVNSTASARDTESVNGMTEWSAFMYSTPATRNRVGCRTPLLSSAATALSTVSAFIHRHAHN